MKLYCPYCNEVLLCYTTKQSWEIYNPIPFLVVCSKCKEKFYSEDVLELALQMEIELGLKLIDEPEE